MYHLGGAALGLSCVLHSGDLHLGHDGELHEAHLPGGQQVMEHNPPGFSGEPLNVKRSCEKALIRGIKEN